MATTTNFGWETPDDTDLVKDGALAIRTLGSAIDTSFVDLKGGTTGQILSKASNTDLDYTWIANDQGDITEVSAGTGISVASGTGPVPVVTNTVATTFDAKGDLVVGTGADTFAKLSVGTNGHTLVADSSTATGLKWAAAGGKVLQVVSATYGTSTDNSTSTFADTGVTASITPANTANKVLIMATIQGVYKNASNADNSVQLNIMRGATQLMTSANNYFTRTTVENMGGWAVAWLDSPNTTSSTTYKIQFKNLHNGALVRVQDAGTSSIILLEIGA